jgi:hypothetical protein
MNQLREASAKLLLICLRQITLRFCQSDVACVTDRPSPPITYELMKLPVSERGNNCGNVVVHTGSDT